MDSNNSQEPIGNSKDGDPNFDWHMDENGVIGLVEGELKLDNNQDIFEGEEEQQIRGVVVEETLEQNEDDIQFPESTSDGQSLMEQFIFPEMPEEGKDQDFTDMHDTDDPSLVEQPSKSVTLPSLLEGRPPSRDQQLDMTEDEVDQDSSREATPPWTLGAWDGDEEENWNIQQTDVQYSGIEHGRIEDYIPTFSWDNLPGSPGEDYSNITGNQEGESITESISPSHPPLPTTWDSKLFSRLRIKAGSISAGIEDETLPESSHTDSAGGSAAIPSGDVGRLSRNTQASNQKRSVRTKTTPPRFSSTKMQNSHYSNEKKSKGSVIAQYGRGQLNYPMLDFSKVGPRVRLPRDDQRYRPPQPRRPENQSQSAPVLFKSPADIVKEVLLTSAEKPVQEPAVPPMVPQEFKSPKQATDLAHQLQEDYHKLLTKYAEAENTIDRLRLGAKVHLYSDPAKPGHSVQMGTVMQGSKVMEFTVPHAQSATFSSANEDNAVNKKDTGLSDPVSHSASPSDDTLPGTAGSSVPQRPEDNAATLTSYLETLHREVDLFEGLLQGGNLTPEEQRQAAWELRGSLDVLERRYLQAQEKCRQEQLRTGRPFLELDPERELEDAIFQLGVQLDELQERVDPSPQPSPSTDPKRTTHHLDNAPLPSAVVPVPATQTPYPQATSPEARGLPSAKMGTSNNGGPEEYLPQPVRYKHMQLERDYGTLLSTYSSFKSLPDALGMEQDEWPQQLPQIAKPHDHQHGSHGQEQFQAYRPQDHSQASRPQRLMSPIGIKSHHDQVQAVNPQDHQLPTKSKTSHQRHSRSVSPRSLPPAESPPGYTHASRPTNGTNASHMPSSLQQRRASSVTSRQSIAPDEEQSAPRRMPHGPMTFPQLLSLGSSLPRMKEQTPRAPTPELSVSGESIQGSPSHKSRSSKNVSPLSRKESPSSLKGSLAQRRMLSPETDSGFLGSESGRSYLLPKHRPQLSLNSREEPVATQDSSNAAVRNDSRPSINGSGRFPGTRTVLRGNRKQSNPWAGPSEASSPSQGPKSCTESESREQSHIDDSDSDQERSNNVIGEVSSGASLLPSPTDKGFLPIRNILKSRVARDQAIHDLQEEVTQLRHQLENSLNRSAARGTMWQPSSDQKQHDGDGLHISPDLDPATNRHRAPVNDSREDHPWRNPVSHDHDPSHHASRGGRRVQGPYTGKVYTFSDPVPIRPTEHVPVPQCQRCQESERKKHVTMKASTEDQSFLPTHQACPFCKGKNGSDTALRTVTMKASTEDQSFLPTHQACPFCKGKNGSDTALRTGMTNGENRSQQRHPHCQHWYMSHPPPVRYMPGPFEPYNPSVIYSTQPGIYVPFGYNVADVRSSTPIDQSSSHISDFFILDDLSRALEAAKEMKVTSKRMCQSLTSDLSTQRSLRGSCLF